MNYKTFSKVESKELIKHLVDQFYDDFGGVKNPQMKEAQLEEKYIKPFFSYLNWNIHNTGLPKGKEEFRVQTSLKVKNTTKEPDYELWLPDINSHKMRRHLFIEAKDPKYDLQKDVKYIRQAYLYAHNTLNLSDHSFNRTRLALLTDFEEFRLFDCFDDFPLTKNDPEIFRKYIVKPFDLVYTDYEKEFNLIWDTFERTNVQKGSLSNFKVTDSELKKDRKAPDLRFLDDLKKWRIDFAKSMFKSNKNVTDDFLTAASQVIINRIIFLKMLTDRGFENDYLTMILENLEKEKEEISIYESCKNIFVQLDKMYNGDIFKKREEFDYVQIENKIFRQIIDNLRPEKSLYNFSAMPIEIIGNAYEQFLGEVIIHKGRGITSEQKPEVQQAGGVYYTPRYVVDYIVNNTLGQKLNELKTPNEVSKIKILDPACGSGSFLIGAYDYLIEWHINYYKEQIENLLTSGKSESEIRKKYKKELKVYFNSNENLKVNDRFVIHLTSHLKKSILLNNIYGVDIDQNAVEITKFSLSMKALENATRDELYEDVDLFNEQLLPKLESNIKSGNSIISDDIGTLFKNIDLETEQTLKPFSWEDNFKTVLKENKFDCIIGNPPYITYSLGKGRTKTENVSIEYLIKKWKNSSQYKLNSFAIFYELSISLLNNNGFCSFIVPGTMHINSSTSKLRKFILDNNLLYKYMKLDYKVFDDAEMGDCSIMVLHKNNDSMASSYHIYSPEEIDSSPISNISKAQIQTLDEYRFLRLNEDYSLLKSNDNFISLEKCCKFYNGIKSGDNKKFITDKKIDKNYKPIIRGRDFSKYSPVHQEKYILFDKDLLWSNFDETKLSVKPKVIIRQTSDSIMATLDQTGYYPMDTVHLIYESSYDFKLLLALINAPFFNLIHSTLVPETGKAFAEVKIANLKKIQIPKLELISSKDEIISLVDDLLKTKHEMEKQVDEGTKEVLISRAHRIEKQINSLIEETIKKLTI